MGYAKKLKNLIGKSKEVKASSAYVICSVIQNCLSFITLPLFARILTKEEYGISTVYTSSMGVAIIFTTLNLAYGSFSPAMMKFDKDRYGYISAVDTICIFLTSLYFIIYFSAKDFWNSLVDLPTELMVLMGFEMLFITAVQLWMGKVRFEYKYKPFIIVTLMMTILGIGSSILAVLILPNKGVVKVVANGIVVSVIGFILLTYSIIKGKQCFNREYWKYALKFNIPLIPYYLSQIIFNQSDRLMINKMTGKGDAATYGVAYTLAFVLTFVLNAINNSFVPWMYRMIKENKLQDNKKVSIIIAGIMAVLLLGVIALAPEIILIVAGKKFMSAIWVVPPVAMSLLLLFYSQLFINIEFYYEEKYKLVGASILAAVVNIILNYYGIKKFGFVAAGYTTLISYGLFAGCNYLAMKKMCKEKAINSDLYNYRLLVVLFVVFATIGVALTAIYPFRWVRLGLVAILIMIVYIFNKKIVILVKDVLQKIKG